MVRMEVKGGFWLLVLNVADPLSPPQLSTVRYTGLLHEPPVEVTEMVVCVEVPAVVVIMFGDAIR